MTVKYYDYEGELYQVSIKEGKTTGWKFGGKQYLSFNSISEETLQSVLNEGKLVDLRNNLMKLADSIVKNNEERIKE